MEIRYIVCLENAGPLENFNEMSYQGLKQDRKGAKGPPGANMAVNDFRICPA